MQIGRKKFVEGSPSWKFPARGNAISTKIFAKIHWLDLTFFVVFILPPYVIIGLSNWQNLDIFYRLMILFLLIGQTLAVIFYQNYKKKIFFLDGVFEISMYHDPSGYTHAVSSADRSKDAISTDQFLGIGLFERLHITSRPAYLKALSDAVHSNSPKLTTLLIRVERPGADHLAREQYIPFEACFMPDRASVLRKTDGRLRGVFRAAHDANGALEITDETSKLKLGKLEHELRTPLNAIVGFSELLADPKMVASDDPRRAEYMKIIATAGRHMIDIIDDMSVHPDRNSEKGCTQEKTSFQDLVDEAVGMLSLSARAARSDVSNTIDPALVVPPNMRHSIRQVLLNLISNSVKYAPAGKIRIEAQEDGGVITVSISDNGIGVGSDDIRRLAEPYFRASGHLKSQAEGQGLGLSVVQGIVDRLGGVLVFESAPGKGTKVVFRLRADGTRLSEREKGQEAQKTFPGLDYHGSELKRA